MSSRRIPIQRADPANIAPDAPVIESATQIDRVDLTPVLVSGMYVDTDHDDHFQSQWQISTESNFSTLVLDETSQNQLTAYTVGEMVLDVDTVYYWRVKFIDARNGESDWSQPATFTTIAADSAGDPNYNGVPDAQEVDESVDVNENGIADLLEANMISVNTVEGQTIVGVETISDHATLVSVKSLATDMIPDQSVKMGFRPDWFQAISGRWGQNRCGKTSFLNPRSPRMRSCTNTSPTPAGKYTGMPFLRQTERV